MRQLEFRRRLIASGLILGLSGMLGCESYPFLGIGADAAVEGDDKAPAGNFNQGEPFTEVLLDGRTFTNPTAVTTITYIPGDRTRRPFLIDFNGDGKADPVVSYAQATEDVWQILLSVGPIGDVDFFSLTLDRKQRANLLDTAVGDIDGDGALDIIGASEAGVVYLHNPGPGEETILRAWGSENLDEELLDNTTDTLTADEINDIITQVLPPGTNLDNYDITVEQGYTNVEIADYDDDSDEDVIASRRFKLTLTPKPDTNVEPITIISGELQLLLNPGLSTTTGVGWQLASIGRHERAQVFDREGASGLLAYDMDLDGDFDVVAAARDDGNAQLAWFENPGPVNIATFDQWTQWRIGSVRDSNGFDIADLTGDGLPDVLANGALQQQTVLFEQPSTGPNREFDWTAYDLVTYETFMPNDVRVMDIDADGTLEFVVTGSAGAVRYFDRNGDPRLPWTPTEVATFDPPGNVGKLGYGDLDADGDLDLVAVLNDDEEAAGDNFDRVVWIRNE